jgi:SAM-dependent methyltransferase
MTDYWETRYRGGGNSGKGSRGWFADEKALLVNRALARHRTTSVLDLGCGDGYVASLISVMDYLGVDPSPSALAQARQRNPDLLFAAEPDGPRQAHLSLDVIRHLIDDADYARHMGHLFTASELVLVWSSDVDEWGAPHDRQRRWTPDIPAGWRIESETPIDGINSRFYVLVRG